MRIQSARGIQLATLAGMDEGFCLLLLEGILPSLSSLSLSLSLSHLMFIFERGRGRQNMSMGGTERERERGDTESEAGSRLWAISTEPDVELELKNRVRS